MTTVLHNRCRIQQELGQCSANLEKTTRLSAAPSSKAAMEMPRECRIFSLAMVDMYVKNVDFPCVFRFVL